MQRRLEVVDELSESRVSDANVEVIPQGELALERREGELRRRDRLALREDGNGEIQEGIAEAVALLVIRMQLVQLQIDET